MLQLEAGALGGSCENGVFRGVAGQGGATVTTAADWLRWGNPTGRH